MQAPALALSIFFKGFIKCQIRLRWCVHMVQTRRGNRAEAGSKKEKSDAFGKKFYDLQSFCDTEVPLGAEKEGGG